VVYSFLTVDPKLDSTLSNFTETVKADLGQEVKDFHEAGKLYKSSKCGTTLWKETSSVTWWWLETLR